ncbi:MAG: HEAT repeat domain-containing protein [Deltaproteobacteria bacterium]|nr:HEAT repeat domain-containing protein [Deltaproteobacteria bacterium]
MERALDAVALTRADLGMRPDIFTHPQTFRRFLRWMKNPLGAPIEAQSMASRLFELSPDPTSWFKALAEAGDLASSTPLPMEGCPECAVPHDRPEPLRKALRLLLDAVYTANRALALAREGIPAGAMKRIQSCLLPQVLATEDSRQEGDDVRRPGEIREALRVAGDVSRKALVEASLTVLEALARATHLLTGPEMAGHEVTSFSFTTPLGLVVVGGRGPDIHDREAALIIDLGGDDLYRGRVASGHEGRCSLLLDLSGNDLYWGEDLTQGSGFWGIGILLDLTGDDLYRAGNCAQGSGIFGTGLLIDREGNDRYLGAEFVQASSSWGFGGLIDLSGEDLYECASSGQAYSGVLGVSCLTDLGGNDRYIAGSNAPDPREPDSDQSFAQGFSMGMRNLAPGGFSLLADGNGNDIYHCQYFGQGSSYWMGIGILYDAGGKDTCMARRYAQGAGIHFSLGMLLDGGGNDTTSSWGVSQGCGHDYGIGILVNRAGNDSYVSDWLSMGASEANGIGIFVDTDGDDRYLSGSGMGVGRLTPSRRAGGIGLFVDAHGKDHYAGTGSDDTTWGGNRWGVGIDENGGHLNEPWLSSPGSGPPDSSAIQEKKLAERARLQSRMVRAQALPFPRDVEALLALSSHWGLEQDIPAEAQEKLLRMDPRLSVPAMVHFLDTPNILGLLFMEKFFFAHAFYALPRLMEKTMDPDPRVSAVSLHMLALLKDTRAIESLRAAMGSPVWLVRTGAVRAIGEMLNRGRLDTLLPMKEALSRALRRNGPGPIRAYLNHERAPMALSVLARSFPLDYETYQLVAEIPSGPEGEGKREQLGQLLFSHLKDMISLLERWIRDIQDAGDTAQNVMGCLNDPDPAVRKSAVYALGQMRHAAALERTVDLLRDPDRWVRDGAILSLALFRDEALPGLEKAMANAKAAQIILCLDALAGIGTDASKALIRRVLDHPDQNVRRTARRAMEP